MPPELQEHTGRVQKHWWTATGERAVQIGTAAGTLTFKGALPPVITGSTLHIQARGTEIHRATRIIQPTEITRAFFAPLRGHARKTAQALIAAHGYHLPDLLLDPAAPLQQVVPPGTLRTLTRHAQANARLLNTLWLLADAHLPPEHCPRWLKAHDTAAPRIFRENPYLALKFGVPLAVIDHAARHLGISSFDPRRGPALVHEVLRDAHQQHGHTALPLTVLMGELADQHALDHAEAQAAIQAALAHEYVTEDRAHLALPAVHATERQLARDIIRLITAAEAARPAGNPSQAPPAPGPGPSLSPSQAAARTLALSRSLCVITGGPGTGKTTTLRSIIDTLTAQGLTVTLAAPTGKAAARMRDSTGQDATTLHRLLGYDGDTFQDPVIDTNVLIIDEASMCSTDLLGGALHALPDGTRVILVGDADQLPPIDAGHPLHALTRTVPTARLTETHRQAQHSPILTLAHQLIAGDPPRHTGVPFHPARTTRDLVDLARVTRERTGRLPMILTAGHHGPLGTATLNRALQACFNPPAPSSAPAGERADPWPYRLGDPVIANRNNHASGLMNGMTGVVVDVSEHALTVDFDGALHAFTTATQAHLGLAYAITIHRSQGSEWPEVIVVLTLDHERLLSRQLAYTAVTRARTEVIASGERQAWTAAAVTPTPPRFGLLERYLRD